MERRSETLEMTWAALSGELTMEEMAQLAASERGSERDRAYRVIAFSTIYNGTFMLPHQAARWIDETYPGWFPQKWLTGPKLRAAADAEFEERKRWLTARRNTMAIKAFWDDWMTTEMVMQRTKERIAMGDLDLIPEAVQTLKRRAAMMGYDAAQKIEMQVQGANELTDVQREQARRALAAAQEFEAALLGPGEDDDED